MLTRHTAWGDSEAGRQRKGSSWRPASEPPQAVRIGPRYSTAQEVNHRMGGRFGALTFSRHSAEFHFCRGRSCGNPAESGHSPLAEGFLVESTNTTTNHRGSVRRRTSPGRSTDRTCVPSRDEQGCNCAGRISQSLSGAGPTDCRRTLASPHAAGAPGGLAKSA